MPSGMFAKLLSILTTIWKQPKYRALPGSRRGKIGKVVLIALDETTIYLALRYKELFCSTGPGPR
jgi:hypothetical protein